MQRFDGSFFQKIMLDLDTVFVLKRSNDWKKKLGLLYDILMRVSLKIYQRLIHCVDPKETKTDVVLTFVTEKNRASLHRLDGSFFIYIYIRLKTMSCWSQRDQNDVVLICDKKGASLQP